MLADDGEARIESVALANADKPEGPAVVTIDYRVPHAVSAEAGRRSLRLAALVERLYLSTPFVAERRTPFEWLVPLTLTSQVRLRLPAPPEPAARARRATGEGEFCAWSLAAAPGSAPHELVLDFHFEAKPGTHPAARYAAFHEAFDAALRAWDAPIGWQE
jgi:hypothetical protein